MLLKMYFQEQVVQKQAWDDTDGDAYILGQASAANQFGYRNSVAGFDISASYAKNGGSSQEDDANADAGDDSDKTIVVSTSSLMDGLTVGAGYGKLDDANSLDIEKHSTMFAKYAAGPVTVGYQYAEINEAGNDSKANMFGVSFNVNENIAVSYNMRDVEIGDGNASLTRSRRYWYCCFIHNGWYELISIPKQI
jgi:outer membrane protein OmpU